MASAYIGRDTKFYDTFKSIRTFMQRPKGMPAYARYLERNL